jgi:hydrogenase expression/formation protein HypE
VVISKRHNLQFNTSIQSDTHSLHDLVASMIQAVPAIHCLRDPTRGGLATTLNELASQSEAGFVIDETAIPIRTEVLSACELLGLDPLYVANEGKLVAICAPEDADRLLKTMRSHPLGQQAAIIGQVINDPRHFVQLKTKLGGMRIMDWLAGEQLPRIC